MYNKTRKFDKDLQDNTDTNMETESVNGAKHPSLTCGYIRKKTYLCAIYIFKNPDKVVIVPNKLD